MTVIVIEDGSIVEGANSYVSEAEIADYHEARGNTAWENADEEAQTQAMVRATFGMETQYNGRWAGVKTQSYTQADGTPADPVQERAWPRVKKSSETSPTLLSDEDGIEVAANVVPTPVKYAMMEISLIELSTRFANQALLTSDQVVKKEKVGSIEVEYTDSGTASVVDRWPFIDQILSSFAPSGGSTGGIDVVIGVTAAEANQGASQSLLDYPSYFSRVGA